MAFIIENILDMLEASGESVVSEVLSAFSCPQNSEIETFLHQRAIDFAKRKLSITYVVTDVQDGSILGYFALAHKAIEINESGLSRTICKKLSRYSRYDSATGNYSASAFLLAQFGKNYGVDHGKRITGSELMEVAMDVLVDIQRRIGGGVIYLDAEERPHLMNFYETVVKFKCYDERFSDTDNTKYLQYMKLF